MLTYCILTVIGGYYLRAYNSDIVTFDFCYEDHLTRWTIDENSNTGAYRICSAKFTGYCLAVAEGRTVQNREIVTLAKADSANPVFWIFNRTEGGTIRPYDKPLYWNAVNIEDYMPIRLLNVFNPNYNYSTFRIEVCPTLD